MGMGYIDEDAKEQIAEDIENYLYKNMPLTQRDVDVYMNPGHESYVTIEINGDVNLSTEQIRGMTDVHLDYVDWDGYVLHASPA